MASLITAPAKELIQNARQVTSTKKIKRGDTLLLDFFAGAGGATQGFVLAGFKPVYIVEAAEFKRKQYCDNFSKHVKVHERGSADDRYYVYERTAEMDATIMINYLAELVGRTSVRYHVHASPSCREFCAVGRSENTKTNKLGDSLGTFRWTCKVIKLLKDKYKDKMTWSIEDAKEVAGKKGKRFDFPALRRNLPECTFNVWDFTLWGVPQDRKRFIALDKSLNISNLPEPINSSDIDENYLSKLVEQLNLEETKKDARKYSRREMKGRIGMDTAFRLAGLSFPEGVTHMMGQNTFGQVPNLIRVYNKKRLAAKKVLNEMKKKDKKATVTKKEIHDKEHDYEEIYTALTTLAYVDLVKFIQSCTPEVMKNFYNDNEIIEYVQKSHNWLKDIEEWEVKNYCEAMYYALDLNYAAATKKNKTAHAQIPLDNVLKWLCKKSKLYPKIIEINKKIKNAKTSDLRDYFGLRIARAYSNDILPDGSNLDKPPTTKRLREIWAPAFTIQAQSDKNWYRPLMKQGDKRWYTTAMKFSFFTIEQLKALGTFPLNYDFGSSKRDEVRYAVGDSVPPLVTLRLGLTIKNKKMDNETALQALLNYTPLGAMMDELFERYEKFLLKERELAGTTVKMYMNVVQRHFSKYEFLGSGMTIKFDLVKKSNKNRGVDQSAALRWIEFLEKMENSKFFTETRIKKHIRDRGLWRKKYGWIKKNRWAHSDKDPNRNEASKEAYERKLKAFYNTIKDYDPSDETKSILERGFRVRLRILTPVLSYINEVRKNEKEKEEKDIENKYGFVAIRTLKNIYSDSDTETDEEEEPSNLLKF